MIDAGSVPSVARGGFLNGVPPGDLCIKEIRNCYKQLP